ncbi:MAG: HAD family hydrolase, partial [Ruminiclostridium sp.]|nr:HAD family hydrolase [Ruminiclostridium sp.]
DLGIKTAVVTNKDHNFAVEMVNHYFGDLIDCIYGAVEGYPKKPSPYWLEFAINCFGFDKKEILYVGDSGVDMETAKNAGVESCGVLWGFRTKSELVEAGCNHVCSNCDDIKKLILES